MNLYVFLVSSPSHIITNKATFVWQTVKVDYAKPPFAIECLNSNRNISFHLRPAKVLGGDLGDFYLLELSLEQNYNAVFL